MTIEKAMVIANESFCGRAYAMGWKSTMSIDSECKLEGNVGVRVKLQ